MEFTFQDIVDQGRIHGRTPPPPGARFFLHFTLYEFWPFLVQGYQLNIAVFFWYLVKSDLPSVIVNNPVSTPRTCRKFLKSKNAHICTFFDENYFLKSHIESHIKFIFLLKNNWENIRRINSRVIFFNNMVMRMVIAIKDTVGNTEHRYWYKYSIPHTEL